MKTTKTPIDVDPVIVDKAIGSDDMTCIRCKVQHPATVRHICADILTVANTNPVERADLPPGAQRIGIYPPPSYAGMDALEAAELAFVRAKHQLRRAKEQGKAQ